MNFQFMWWGSLLQSVAPDCFLKMRQQLSFGNARFFKRLDPDESSTGVNASFADSWLRSDFEDLNVLYAWTIKQDRKAVIVFDLWRWALRGEPIAKHADLLGDVIDRACHVVFLMPRVSYGGWREWAKTLLRDPKKEGVVVAQRMETLRETYEFLINWGKVFSVMESSVTEPDFVQLLDLDFARTRKLAGLVHLMPKDLAYCPIGLHPNEGFVNTLSAVLVRGTETPVRALQVSLPYGQASRFRGLHPICQDGGLWTHTPPLVRRPDGVFAVPTSWNLYQRAVVTRPTLGFKKALKITPQDRLWLMFLVRYEALLTELKAKRERHQASDVAMFGDVVRELQEGPSC